MIGTAGASASPGGAAGSTTSRLVAVICNPKAGRRFGARGLSEVEATLERSGAEVIVLPTLWPGHAADLAEALVRERPGRTTDLVALGGDGTLNEVLLGAWRAGAFRGDASADPVRIGILPAGTTNVVARSLGIPADPEAASRALAAAGGRTRALDVGLCVNGEGERPFLLAFGAGFDAEVLLKVGAASKRWLGPRAYTLAALRHCGERERGLTVRYADVSGIEHEAPAASVILATCTRYAGKLRLALESAPDDGLLELALLPSTSMAGLLRAGITATISEMRRAPGVVVVQVRRASIRATCRVPVHVDAEIAGTVPAEVSVLPRALAMLVT